MNLINQLSDSDRLRRASNEFFSLQDFGRSPVAPMSAQQVWAPVERLPVAQPIWAALSYDYEFFGRLTVPLDLEVFGAYPSFWALGDVVESPKY